MGTSRDTGTHGGTQRDGDGADTERSSPQLCLLMALGGTAGDSGGHWGHRVTLGTLGDTRDMGTSGDMGGHGGTQRDGDGAGTGRSSCRLCLSSMALGGQRGTLGDTGDTGDMGTSGDMGGHGGTQRDGDGAGTGRSSRRLWLLMALGGTMGDTGDTGDIRTSGDTGGHWDGRWRGHRVLLAPAVLVDGPGGGQQGTAGDSG